MTSTFLWENNDVAAAFQQLHSANKRGRASSKRASIRSMTLHKKRKLDFRFLCKARGIVASCRCEQCDPSTLLWCATLPVNGSKVILGA
jgi:hypothetical protein